MVKFVKADFTISGRWSKMETLAIVRAVIFTARLLNGICNTSDCVGSSPPPANGIAYINVNKLGFPLISNSKFCIKK